MNNRVLELIFRKKSRQEKALPFYVFDTDYLNEHIANIKNRLPEQITLCYAIKANPFLIKAMDQQMEKYEVCSPGELDICIRAGIDMQKVVFSGVNKQPEDVAKAIDAGVGIVTLESLRHFELVRDYAEQKGCAVKVLPRLSNGAQFGMDEKELEQLIAQRKSYPLLCFVGVQYFTGTQKKQKKILEELAFITDYMDGLKAKYSFEGRLVEYGPGFKVPYFQGEDFSDPYAELEEAVRFVKEQKEKYQYVFELGRYIAAGCGYYAASVVDKKQTKGAWFALLDGGMNHVNYYGQTMAMRIPRITHYQKKTDSFYDASDYHEKCTTEEKLAQTSTAYCLCGSLCTFADVLVRKMFFKELQLGDVLVFHQIGAYSITEGIYLFLSRTMPEVYLYSEENGLLLVREKFETSSVNGC